MRCQSLLDNKSNVRPAMRSHPGRREAVCRTTQLEIFQTFLFSLPLELAAAVFMLSVNRILVGRAPIVDQVSPLFLLAGPPRQRRFFRQSWHWSIRTWSLTASPDDRAMPTLFYTPCRLGKTRRPVIHPQLRPRIAYSMTSPREIIPNHALAAASIAAIQALPPQPSASW